MQGKIEKIVSVSEGKDLDDIMKLWFESNLQAHDFISKDYWMFHFEEVKTMMPQAELFVWKNERKILGFLGLMGNYIAGIFVDEKYRSQGIGKMLLDDIKEIQDELVLHVYEKNKSALGFYRREGFQILGEQREEETGEKEYLMKWMKMI